MPSLNNYRKILGSHTSGEAKKNQSDMIMEATWDEDVQSTVAYVYDYYHDDEPLIYRDLHPEKSRTKCRVDIKFITNAYNQESKDEVGKHIQFKPSFDWKTVTQLSYYQKIVNKYESSYPLALYFDIYDRNEKIYRKWLCTEFANTLDNQFPTWYILPCDHLFQWVTDGIKYQMVGVSRSQNSYNSGVWQNRGGVVQLTMPENQRVCVLPMNEISSTIFYDQRIAMSAPTKVPITWKCSKVDNTNPKGILHLTFAQSRWDEHTDAFEYEHIDGLEDMSSKYDPRRTVIGIYADYYSSAVEPVEKEVPKLDIHGEITWNALAQVKVGGSYKKFTINFFDRNDPIDFIPGQWSFSIKGVNCQDLVSVIEDYNVIKVKFIGDDSYIGSVLTIKYRTDTGIETSVDVEIVGL